MKRLLSTTALMFGLAAIVNGQSNYNLKFSFYLNEDTVVMGKGYTLVDSIYNDGPDDFPGGDFKINVAVAKPSKSETATADSSFTITLPYIDAGGTASVAIKNFKLPAGKDSKLDSLNIVIVWPTGDVKNGPKYKNKSTMLVYVKTAANNAGIAQAVNPDLNMSLYPNPASSMLNTELHSAAMGTLKMMDVNGRVIGEYAIHSGENKLNIPVGDVAHMPDGVYLINLDAGETHAVRKVIISR